MHPPTIPPSYPLHQLLAPHRGGALRTPRDLPPLSTVSHAPDPPRIAAVQDAIEPGMS